MLQAPVAEPIPNGNHSSNGTPRPAEVIKDGAPSPPEARRNRLPDERASTTHKFRVGTHEGYLTVGLYPDGQPGEIFIVMAKEGSPVSGLINSFAQAISIGLQFGVPLRVFCEKFSFTRFEPSGWTGNPAIPQASSVMDYIFRWLEKKFFSEEISRNDETDLISSLCTTAHIERLPPPPELAPPVTQATDAPSCRACGSLMRRNGSCHACSTCGWTSGCS
jgi:ribonucleoside-diphosphate reductase alpha chain